METRFSEKNLPPKGRANQIPTFSQILNEARRENPGSNNIIAILFYRNLQKSISNQATDKSRRIEADKKLQKANILLDIFYKRRN